MARYNAGMDHQLAARRFAVTLDLFEAGVEMMRARLRREQPQLSAGEIEGRVRSWLAQRPPPAPPFRRREIAG